MAGAGESQARLDFIGILTRLDRKFEIILIKWVNNKDFEIRIRTEIDRDNDDFNTLCDQWVDMFSTVTHTVWAKKISNTGPKIRFRKQYQCWTQGGGKVIKELLFDSRRCKGILDMKVLTDTPLTRRKNKHIRQGLNAVVKINFSHLHPVNTEVPYSCFVHSCNPRPETIIPDIPNEATSLQIQELKLQEEQEQQQQQEIPIQITAPDLSLSEPLLLYQPSIIFDTLSSATLPHVVHSHAHVHHNQHTTPHGHYL